MFRRLEQVLPHWSSGGVGGEEAAEGVVGVVDFLAGGPSLSSL